MPNSQPPSTISEESSNLSDEPKIEQPQAFVNTPLKQLSELTSELKDVLKSKTNSAQIGASPQTSAESHSSQVGPSPQTTPFKPQGKPAKPSTTNQPKPPSTKPTVSEPPKPQVPNQSQQPQPSKTDLPQPKGLPVQMAAKAPPRLSQNITQLMQSVRSQLPIGTKKGQDIKLSNLETGDSWETQGTGDYFDCRKIQCHSGLLKPRYDPAEEARMETKEHITSEAVKFLNDYQTQFNVPSQQAQVRIQEVKQSIQTTGTYKHTPQELTFGARMAWRNAPKCIGRLVWSKLQVLDRRDCTEPSQIYNALVDHLKFATNNGNIVTTISIFPQKEIGKPGFRIWNSQLLR